MAADLPWRTLESVQGHTRSGLVEGFIQAGQAYAGWSPWTKQPGDEGARRSGRLRLLVAHRLVFHPAQPAQLHNHLPAETGGSLRAHGQVASLGGVMEHRLACEAPQSHLQRCTHTGHAVCALGRSKQHMIQRQWGRLEPPPSLQDRADAVMRNIPALST
jgi:hypothetical protein